VAGGTSLHRLDGKEDAEHSGKGFFSIAGLRSRLSSQNDPNGSSMCDSSLLPRGSIFLRGASSSALSEGYRFPVSCAGILRSFGAAGVSLRFLAPGFDRHGFWPEDPELARFTGGCSVLGAGRCNDPGLQSRAVFGGSFDCSPCFARFRSSRSIHCRKRCCPSMSPIILVGHDTASKLILELNSRYGCPNSDFSGRRNACAK